VACTEPPPLYPANSPPDIVQACTLTQQKCTACHDRDRIVHSQMSPNEWRETVERMRRFPGSNISPTEQETILRCLLHRASTTSSLDDVDPALCALATQPRR
jgi:hypothetical protein